MRSTILVILLTAFASLLLASPGSARNVIVVDGTGGDGAVLRAPEIQPGDTVTTIDYPATMMWPSYDQSVEAGKRSLRAELASSPEGTLVIGYSQGSRIAGDVLTEPQHPGVTGVLYSDPRQTGSGVETQTWMPSIFGVTMSGERSAFTVPVESKCIEGDGVCDWRNNDPVGSVIGYLRHHQRYYD
ncbi:PE-PPE domain-containing protein [Rhodococcus globerulus]|uniref:PE-PPE domain-containing protein n=1 Tax=Rhodococcus globerulus TaxID=33008 RepID=A0ABU4C512_RHOGO|nr:PE-PPE domain-containing protein [Rhodococcus globerulus]MDV6271606.1 PE-PPE domain-containing protein [Rhodococcus globerulus]